MANPRGFLKWAGSKAQIADIVIERLPKSTTLIEPFVGSGAIFVHATNFEEYVLNDINPDLINLYKILRRGPKKFIKQVEKLFSPENNCPEVYYRFRDRFNQSDDLYERALLFVYLNRHGYNGLCRYNLSGGYNVPFGKYKKPYCPVQEMFYFAMRLKTARLTNHSFHESFRSAKVGQTLYCDPPYVGLGKTANFVSYASNKFTFEDQKHLVKLANKARNRGVNVVISNHNIPLTQKLYSCADEQVDFLVQRSISQKGDSRNKVSELIANYHGRTRAIIT